MNPQRIAVTGASGLLGRELTGQLLQRGHHVIAGVHRAPLAPSDELTVLPLDLLDSHSIVQFVENADADWIVHAAATTDVDGCETNVDFAERLHVSATTDLMRAVSSTQTRVLYISTDYVFDGRNGPYDEDATPAPINVYGRTKLGGEKAVLHAGEGHAVIRSGSFLGVGLPGRPTFAETMLKRMIDNPPLPAATDQRSNITPVDTLAAAIVEIGEERHSGIWHVASDVILSRYDFALRLARLFGCPESAVSHVEFASLNRPAPRPLNGGLISKRVLKRIQPDLRAALLAWKRELDARDRNVGF